MKAVVLDFATAEVIIIDADCTKAVMKKYIENTYDDANTQYMYGDNIKIKRQKLNFKSVKSNYIKVIKEDL